MKASISLYLTWKSHRNWVSKERNQLNLRYSCHGRVVSCLYPAFNSLKGDDKTNRCFMILQGEGGGPSSAFQLEVSKSWKLHLLTVFQNVTTWVFLAERKTVGRSSFLIWLELSPKSRTRRIQVGLSFLLRAFGMFTLLLYRKLSAKGFPKELWVLEPTDLFLAIFLSFTQETRQRRWECDFALMFLFVRAVVNSLPARQRQLFGFHCVTTNQIWFLFLSFHNASSYSLRLISPIGESPRFAC